jgi:hypothetical protein
MPVQTSVSVAPAIAFAGQLADDAENDAITLLNAEASASMPFGSIVAFKTAAPVSEKDAILPAASTAKIAGIIIHRHNYAKAFPMNGVTVGELDDTGLLVGIPFSCLRSGRIFVICEDGCNPGDPLFVRYAGGTLGAARSTDAGSSTCTDLTNRGTWLSKASAGGIAKLEVDFRNK